MDFITVINKALPPANQYFVEMKIGTTVLASESENNYILSNIEKLPVTKGALRQLLPGCHLSRTVMDCVMKLFQCRNNRICESHKEVNAAHANYEEYPCSIYLPFSAFQDLCSPLVTPQQIIDSYFSTSTGDLIDVRIINKIYLISKSIDSDAVWVLYVIDIDNHTVKYLDPRRNSDAIISEDLTVHLNDVGDMLSVFLRVLNPDYTGTWACSILSSYYFSPLTNECDSGLYITTVIYYLCNNVPLCFNAGTISRLRLNLAYWLLNEELPV